MQRELAAPAPDAQAPAKTEPEPVAPVPPKPNRHLTNTARSLLALLQPSTFPVAARVGRGWPGLVLLATLAGCGARRRPTTPSRPLPAPESRTHRSKPRVWEGRWEFNYTLIRLVGATEEETSFQPGNKIRRIWEVTPGCDDRPCNSEISATNPDEPDGGRRGVDRRLRFRRLQHQPDLSARGKQLVQGLGRQGHSPGV